MKKIVFFFLFAGLLFSLNSHAQFENVRLDREEAYEKNESSPNSNPQLDYLSYAEYTYGNGGNLYTHRETFTRPTINDAFTEATMFVRTYDMNDRLETVTLKIHNGVDYMDTSQTLYDYNNNGDISTKEIFVQAGGWLQSSLDSYFYNNDFTLDYIISANWDFLANDYVDYQTQEKYAYVNDLLKTIVYYNYSGNTPIFDYRDTYSYDFNNEIDYILRENYIGSNWVNSRLEDYTFFVDLLLDVIYQRWDSNSNSWINESRFEYGHNIDRILSQIVIQAYDENLAGKWYDTYKIVYFTSTLSTDDFKTNKGLAYPNPFKNHLTISLPKSLSTDGELYLYDNMGKEITKTELKSGTKSISLSNGHLAKGIYFVKISNQEYQQTIKIVKE